MPSSEDSKNKHTLTEGFYSPSDEQVAVLQSILQKESHEPVSLKEAQEVGIQLVSLYECLARDRKTPTSVEQNNEL